MAERIKYNDDKLTTGVQVPDSLITVGGTETYKLLEALNIDWENLTIPNARTISKWNSTGVNPLSYNTVTDYLSGIDANSGRNMVNNSTDWLNSKYDYLTDGINDDVDSSSAPRILLPPWSLTGTINDSKDIADILNYLIWRVVNIDYFTGKWDKRNLESVRTEYGFWFSSSFDNLAEVTESLIGSDVLKESVGDTIYNYFLYSSTHNTLSDITINLIPSPNDRNSKTILDLAINGNIIKSYYENNNIPSSIIHSAIMSTANGRIVPNQYSLPDDEKTFTISIGNNGESNESIRILDNPNDENLENATVWYLFNLDYNIIGTGNYKSLSTWLPAIVNNINNEKDYFDPISLNWTINYLQTGDDSTVGSTTDKQLNLTIQKLYNSLNSFTFNGKTLGLTSIESTTSKIYSTSTDINIPFYMTDVSEAGNRYELNFSVTYGSNYGIKPYFFISGANYSSIQLDANNDFTGFSNSEYGNITIDNGKYYYTPPTQGNNSINKDIYINCVWYYNDSNASRQVSPIILTFKVILNVEVKNKFIFITGEQISVYSNNQREGWGFWPTNTLSGLTNWCNDVDVINNETENGVSYCIKTIQYDDFINVTQSEISPELLPFNSGTVRTSCSSPITVEFIGKVGPELGQGYNDRENNPVESSLSRNIILDTTQTDGNKVTITTEGETLDYPIYSDESLHIGENNGKYYYDNDKYTNYHISDKFLYEISQLNIEENIDLSIPTITPLIDTTSNSDYLEILNNDSTWSREHRTINYPVYKIARSTAKYPIDNGILEKSGVLVDADNDYDYLVFKLTSPSGSIGNISYSPALAFYILRVVRQQNVFELSFKDTTQEEITFVGATNHTYSFRTMPRIPIPLNRLFTEKSQSNISRLDGILYWKFYGVEAADNASIKWDDKLVAISDERTGNNEDFMKIYNIGDSYPYKSYNTSSSKINRNATFTPEGGITITYETSDGNKTVGKFNKLIDDETSTSGSILYINKLMKAIYTLNQETMEQEVTDYKPIDTSDITLSLALSIGNSTNYTRLNNLQTFTLKIFKKTYDIGLFTSNAVDGTNDNGIRETPFTATNPLELTVPQTIPEGPLTFSDAFVQYGGGSAIFAKRGLFALYSNEFGTGSDLSAETSDRLEIRLNDNNLPVIDLFNNLYTSIQLTSINTNNSSWVVSGNTVNVDNNYLFNVMYFLNDDSTLNNRKRIIHVLPLEASGNSVLTLNFKISADDFGIYKEKDLYTFIHINPAE